MTTEKPCKKKRTNKKQKSRHARAGRHARTRHSTPKEHQRATTWAARFEKWRETNTDTRGNRPPNYTNAHGHGRRRGRKRKFARLKARNGIKNQHSAYMGNETTKTQTARANTNRYRRRTHRRTSAAMMAAFLLAEPKAADATKPDPPALAVPAGVL